MYTKTILWKVLFWFCFFLPVKNIVWFNFQSMKEMIRKYSEGGLLLSCVSWKQSQAPVGEFSQPLVATSCPLQLFFAPPPVLRPILGQLSNFVTVLIWSALPVFCKSSWEVYLHVSWCGVSTARQNKTLLEKQTIHKCLPTKKCA